VSEEENIYENLPHCQGGGWSERAGGGGVNRESGPNGCFWRGKRG
jgi:hypothetical protein